MPENRPTIYAVGFANNTIADNGEATVQIDVSSVKLEKVKALQAHASQTAWMIEENSKRTDEGQPGSDSWLHFERFYEINL